MKCFCHFLVSVRPEPAPDGLRRSQRVRLKPIAQYKNEEIIWETKPDIGGSGHLTPIPHNAHLGKKPFENIVGKRVNGGNQHCLLPYQRLVAVFEPSWLSRNAFNLGMA